MAQINCDDISILKYPLSGQQLQHNLRLNWRLLGLNNSSFV